MQYTIINCSTTMQGKCLEATVEFDGLLTLNIVFTYHGDVWSVASMTPVNTLQRIAFAACELYIEQNASTIYTQAKDLKQNGSYQ